MTGFPLSYARANLLIGSPGQAAGLYRLGMVAYPYLSPSAKWRLARQLERFVQGVGADFSLWRVQRACAPDRYEHDVSRLVDRRHTDPGGWAEYVRAHSERLSELQSWAPELYLAVSLNADQASGLGSDLVRSIDRTRRRLE